MDMGWMQLASLCAEVCENGDNSDVELSIWYDTWLVVRDTTG